MKRFLTIILSLVLLLGIVVIPASAGKKEKEDDGAEAAILSTEAESEEDINAFVAVNDNENTDEKAAKKIIITGSKYVARGKSISLKATVSPKGASQKVTWSSSDKKIATVSAKGVVKGIKPGKVKITATSKANKKLKKTITIEVKAKAVKKIKITGAKDLDLSGEKTVTLKAKATPTKAAQSFEWKSSNPKVATVDEKGKVTAKKIGTVKITATATDGSKKKQTITIEVKDSASTPIVPTSLEEANAALVNLINTYDGKIAIVPGYEDYEYARLLVKATGTFPNISAYSPVAVINEHDNLYIVQFKDPVQAKNCADYLNKQPGVSYAEPDAAGSLDSTDLSAAERKAYSWGVSRIHADTYAQNLVARNIPTNITVAVIDSGVNTTHALYSNRLVLNGHDFVENDSEPQDEVGHGTHVAGTILDCTPGLNIVILPYKISNTIDKLKTSLIEMAVTWATEKSNAKVINMSLGVGKSNALKDAINKAIAKGITVVASAGNDGIDASSQSPACITTAGCIVVSAIMETNECYTDSNHGSVVDLCAPGTNINGAGGSKSGTSMAAPHVAAAAAMILCEEPNLNPSGVEERLKWGAKDLGDSGRDDYYGVGMVDLEKMIKPIDPPMEGQILHLPFEGNCSDVSGHVTPITMGDIIFEEGIVGNQSAYFDGSGDYLDLGNGYNIQSNFTVNMWILSESASRSDAGLFAKYETNKYGPYDFYLAYNHPAIWVSDGNGGQKVMKSSTVLDYSWHMLTYVYIKESRTFYIYIDGVLDSTFTINFDLITNTDTVTIGRQALMFTPYSRLEYVGYMDDLRVYNRNLNASEISSLYCQKK